MLCFYHSFIIERMLYILQYARFWVRAGAWLIDCVLAVGLHFSSAWIFGDGSHEVAAAALLVYVLYPLLMPLTKLQGTIGKAILEFVSFLMIRADGLSFGRLSCATSSHGCISFSVCCI